MKINLNIPKLTEKFAHDAPLYKVIKLGLPLFIAISSITVFIGVKLHMAEAMENIHWILALPLLAIGYMLFSFSPDFLLAGLVTYVVRSLARTFDKIQKIKEAKVKKKKEINDCLDEIKELQEHKKDLEFTANTVEEFVVSTENEIIELKENIEEVKHSFNEEMDAAAKMEVEQQLAILSEKLVETKRELNGSYKELEEYAILFNKDYTDERTLAFKFTNLNKKLEEIKKRPIPSYFSIFDLSGTILAFMSIVLVFGLASYSYNMSKFSAGSAADNTGQSTTEIDLTAINARYDAEKATIRAEFTSGEQAAKEKYNNGITIAESEYSTNAAPLLAKISSLEKNRVPSNVSWTDKQISNVRKKLKVYNDTKISKSESLLAAKNTEIETLRKTRDSSLEKARQDFEEQKGNKTTFTNTRNTDIAAANEFLKSQLKGISGYAVFIVMILAAAKELLHHRNEIRPQPIISEFDFQVNWLNEIFSFPFVAMQRKAINWVRIKYNALPELLPPPALPVIQNFAQQQAAPIQSRTPQIAMQADDDDDEIRQIGFFNKAVDKNGGAKMEVEKHENNTKPFTAHGLTRNNTKITPKNNTKMEVDSNMNIADLKQRLTLYKKRLGGQVQKKLAKERAGETVSKRTLDAIENNKNWVAHYEAELAKYAS